MQPLPFSGKYFLALEDAGLGQGGLITIVSRGGLDRDALERTWAIFQERFPIARSVLERRTFLEHGWWGHAWVERAPGFNPVRWLDPDELGRPPTWEAFLALSHEQMIRWLNTDLRVREEAPYQVLAYAMPGVGSLLMTRMNHAAMDGVAWMTLNQELIELYNEVEGGGKPEVVVPRGPRPGLRSLLRPDRPEGPGRRLEGGEGRRSLESPPGEQGPRSRLARPDRRHGHGAAPGPRCRARDDPRRVQAASDLVQRAAPGRQRAHPPPVGRGPGTPRRQGHPRRAGQPAAPVRAPSPRVRLQPGPRGPRVRPAGRRRGSRPAAGRRPHPVPARQGQPPPPALRPQGADPRRPAPPVAGADPPAIPRGREGHQRPTPWS